MEILDYVERISEIFEKINLKIESLPNSYKSQSCMEFINSYNAFKSNYSIIKNNMTSYSDDLITLIKRMHETNDYLVTTFQKLTIDAKSKANKIENFEG